jgi:stringent starvation protein B
MTKMTSNRPYLARAIYDWLVDNLLTPHVVVDAHTPGVSVPQQYVSNGQIILNIAPRAVGNFHMDLEAISFTTRFGGIPSNIYVPMPAVLGIYARENGQGMMFGPDLIADDEPPEDDPPPPPRTLKSVPSKPSKAGKPTLKVIK